MSQQELERFLVELETNQQLRSKFQAELSWCLDQFCDAADIFGIEFCVEELAQHLAGACLPGVEAQLPNLTEQTKSILADVRSGDSDESAFKTVAFNPTEFDQDLSTLLNEFANQPRKGASTNSSNEESQT